MIYVTKTYLPPIDDYISRLKDMWRSGCVTNNGPLVRDLALSLRSYLDVKQLELVANGSLALQISIKALGLQGEIITTPYSYVATTSSILWEGCDPVFVDIEDKTFCIDPDRIEAALTERTSAILATHVYGYSCNVDKIEQTARKHGLKVIYDAAHAFGVRLNNRSLCTYGDVSALSFHATKLFHTVEGGAVVCKDSEIAKRINLMKRFGHAGEDDYLEVGINAKMSELHAAMGLATLPMVDEIIAYRKECSGWYDRQLDGISMQRPTLSADLEYNYAYYPVIFPSHEVLMRVRQALLDNNIGSRRYFYPSLNTLPFLKPELKRSCRISEDISSRVVCLPLYFGMQKKDVETICSMIRHALQ